MKKTIEELANQFTNELYPEDDLDTLGDKTATYMTCVAFGNQLMSLPLKDRLTAEEKESIKETYKYHLNAIGDCYTHCMVRDELEHIFGKELFKK